MEVVVHAAAEHWTSRSKPYDARKPRPTKPREKHHERTRRRSTSVASVSPPPELVPSKSPEKKKKTRAQPQRLRTKYPQRRYTTTTETWMVMYVSDRRERHGVLEYLVHWFSERRTRTWEPAAQLRRDKLGPLLALADRYVDDGKRTTFEQFLAADEHGANVLKTVEASDDASCGFLAIRIACERLGLRFSEAVLEEFLAREPPRQHARPVETTWKVLFAFAKRLVGDGTPIHLSVLKRNRVTTSLRGVTGIRGLQLEDGVYVVGAANCVNYGHCFTLELRDGRETTYDDNVATLDAMTWIARVYFVRKFQAYMPSDSSPTSTAMQPK